jgi:eukaryotic-like serine/threonine-protein kinase
MTAESRLYRVHGILGKGGFGTVYRATLEGSDGFRKEVALKVLNDDKLPDTFLGRFRDEARMLGLVRDRAVVAVDPPVILNGQVTLVMEFVDGESGSRLLKRHRFLPIRVTADIVQEVARALDSVYTQRGPNGNPLELLHRDIKPANLQITPGGSVKVLDFGIAKATFDQRESATTRQVMGTVRYMAPERIEGVEGPYGDVFSLGCVFRHLMTGDKPLGLGQFEDKGIVPRTPQMDEVLAFIDRMIALDYKQRPSITEVEEYCSQLSTSDGGQSLRQWARTEVRSAAIRHDKSTGTVLHEGASDGPRLGGVKPGVAGEEAAATPEEKPAPTPAALLAPAMESGSSLNKLVLAGGFVLTSVGGAVAIVAGVVLVGGIAFWLWQSGGPTAAEAPAAVLAVEAPVPASPTPDNRPSEPKTPHSDGAPEQPPAVDAPSPSAEVDAAAMPEHAQPAPAPDPLAGVEADPLAGVEADPPAVADAEPAEVEPRPARPSVSVRLDGLVAVFVDGAGNRVSADGLEAQKYSAMVAFDPTNPGQLVDVGVLDLTRGEGAIRCSATSKRCSLKP